MSRLESLAEKRLREAIENGEFDDLLGKGEPIDLKENPFEDPDLRMAPVIAQRRLSSSLD